MWLYTAPVHYALYLRSHVGTCCCLAFSRRCLTFRTVSMFKSSQNILIVPLNHYVASCLHVRAVHIFLLQERSPVAGLWLHWAAPSMCVTVVQHIDLDK